LLFKTPADHAQDPKEPARSSINAPIHKFRWLHVPGSVHQGTEPFLGSYTYTVTPRYFDNGALKALDPALSVSTTIDVDNFSKQSVELGFTRGFTQSQAFVNHFGKTAQIQPEQTPAGFRHLGSLRHKRARREIHLRRGISMARIHGAGENLRAGRRSLEEQESRR